jgi:hypothetical protein
MVGRKTLMAPTEELLFWGIGRLAGPTSSFGSNNRPPHNWFSCVILDDTM